MTIEDWKEFIEKQTDVSFLATISDVIDEKIRGMKDSIRFEKNASYFKENEHSLSNLRFEYRLPEEDEWWTGGKIVSVHDDHLLVQEAYTYNELTGQRRTLRNRRQVPFQHIDKFKTVVFS